MAAGLVPLAIGTQTLRSTIGPAAYCGVVGLKLSHGRIALDGVVLLAGSIDSLGLFAQDVGGVEYAAGVLVDGWQPGVPVRTPVLAVPEGSFMQYLSQEAREAFARQQALLEKAGCGLVRVRVPWDSQPEDIYQRMIDLVHAEMARFHADWFEAHAELYGRATRLAIQKGGALADQRLTELRADQHALRSALDERLHSAGADLWITPSSWGPAPEGFEITGTSGMTGPWSYAGLPALSLPAGTAANGLPLGLQCIARWNDDERLLAWARGMESVLRSA